MPRAKRYGLYHDGHLWLMPKSEVANVLNRMITKHECIITEQNGIRIAVDEIIFIDGLDPHEHKTILKQLKED